ncbi:MAG TPA: DNA polymerase Y family protein, partial [Aquabacterium sp.]|nr:DNA polymerase Y family protein [Aquabacterium sp.]
MPHWIALIPGQSTRSPCTEPTVLDAQHLGWWCLQFTPRVALLDEAVVAEIQASHRLFGGRTRLVEHMDATSRRLGCIAVAQADTAAAALALARYPGVPLPELPLQAISALRPHSGTLSRLGCRRIQDVMRLPRAGLSRRFGKELLRALDQLDGTQPEAFEWLSLPAVFESRLELPGRIDSAPQLSLGADILIHRLCAWLAGLQAGVQAWTLRWQHDFFRQRDVESQGEYTIRLGAPSRDPKRLTRLMHEHLQRIELAG